MLVSLPRSALICGSFTEVYFIGMAPLGAVRYGFIIFNHKGKFLNFLNLV